MPVVDARASSSSAAASPEGADGDDEADLDGEGDGGDGGGGEVASTSTAEGVSGYASALARAVRKYDLSRNAPTADKSDHVSNVTEKQQLRNILMRDPKLRPLLRGMRQLLDYEALPAWQSPPDLAKLSAAVDAALSQFWKDVKRGTMGNRLAAGHAAKNITRADSRHTAGTGGGGPFHGAAGTSESAHGGSASGTRIDSSAAKADYAFAPRVPDEA